MYKIFINDKCLTLTEKRTTTAGNKHLVVFYEDVDVIIPTIETLEQDSFYTSAEIVSVDVELLWSDFKNQLRIIKAAGGLAVNSENKLLMIFRLGKWDLPKGKMEKDEKKKETALREVEEECGISGLEIIAPFDTTYHCYFLKNERVLKISYWYLMTCTDTKPLIPQLAEDITEARWVDKKEIPVLLDNTYTSIKLLLEEWMALPMR